MRTSLLIFAVAAAALAAGAGLAQTPGETAGPVTAAAAGSATVPAKAPLHKIGWRRKAERKARLHSTPLDAKHAAKPHPLGHAPIPTDNSGELTLNPDEL